MENNKINIVPKINKSTFKEINKRINKTKQNNSILNSTEEQFIKNEITIINNEGQIGCYIS
jgi:acetolactate synthase small subunit